MLNRHLALREVLVRADKIDHDLLFFKASGGSIINLQYPGMRWNRTLSGLKDIRYHRPYTTRHTSVSWDLMIGRSALWVARQHGYSISTMLHFYAAWADGAPESDVDRIRSTVNSARALSRTPAIVRRRRPTRLIARPFEMEFPAAPSQPTTRCATEFATTHGQSAGKPLNERKKTGGERGIRTWRRHEPHQ